MRGWLIVAMVWFAAIIIAIEAPVKIAFASDGIKRSGQELSRQPNALPSSRSSAKAPLALDKTNSCKECDEITNAIGNYQKLIAVELKALAEGEQKVQKLNHERDELKAKSQKTEQSLKQTRGSNDALLIQLDGYQKAIHKIGTDIKIQHAWNKEMFNEIEKNKKNLVKVIAQYQDCVSARCGKQVPVKSPTFVPAQQPPIAPKPIERKQ